MPEFKVSIELEAESLRDLRAIVEHTKQQGIILPLIGGYAARAYTKPTHYRGTKDMDFITLKTDVGKLKGLLKDLGYSIQDTCHGLKAVKDNKHGQIKLDIAVDKVVDDSTGKVYNPRAKSIEQAKQMPITALYDENKGMEVPSLVSPIEDVLAMKLVTDPAQRPRDKFDVLAILLDSGDSLDAKIFAEDCKHSELTDHIKHRLTDLLIQVKGGKARKLWQEYSNFTLTKAQEDSLKESLTTLLVAVKT